MPFIQTASVTNIVPWTPPANCPDKWVEESGLQRFQATLYDNTGYPFQVEIVANRPLKDFQTASSIVSLFHGFLVDAASMAPLFEVYQDRPTYCDNILGPGSLFPDGFKIMPQNIIGMHASIFEALAPEAQHNAFIGNSMGVRFAIETDQVLQKVRSGIINDLKLDCGMTDEVLQDKQNNRFCEARWRAPLHVLLSFLSRFSSKNLLNLGLAPFTWGPLGKVLRHWLYRILLNNPTPEQADHMDQMILRQTPRGQQNPLQIAANMAVHLTTPESRFGNPESTWTQLRDGRPLRASGNVTVFWSPEDRVFDELQAKKVAGQFVTRTRILSATGPHLPDPQRARLIRYSSRP